MDLLVVIGTHHVPLGISCIDLLGILGNSRLGMAPLREITDG